LKKALALTQELADQVIEVQTLWNLLHVYRLTNRLKAIEVGERALVLARKNNLREQMAFILNDLGRCYLVSCYLNRAKETILEVITLWRELHNLPMLTDSLSTIGQTLYYIGEYEQAIVCMKEALQISQSIDNVWGQAFSPIFLGRVYWERGLPTQAIAVMKESIQLGVSIDFIGPQTFTQADLAIVYGSLGAIEQGLESARLAVAAASKVPALGFSALAALASMHLLAGHLAEAETIIDQGKSDPSRDAAPLYFASLTMVEAELLLKQGNAQPAIEVTNALITNFRQSGLQTYLPDCLYLQGQAWLTLGQQEAAYACFLEARAIAEAIGLRRKLWPILFTLSQLEPNPTEAERLLQQAREFVAYIADHTPADLRDSFLALPEVRAVK
jgi:tetratricopeptide (TPR) repeat protein